MSGLNVEEQMEQGLKERIEHKTDNRSTDQKLFDELATRVYKLGNLVAEQHAEVNRILMVEREEIGKIKVALEGYKKAIKK